MDGAEQKTDTKNKIFYTALISLIAVSTIVTFYNIFILKDYQIIAEVSCNPESEECFVWECDPDTDEACPINPEEQTTYYKKISKKSFSIYLCENTDEKIGCGEELSCISNEQSCYYIYCDPNNLEEWEQCSE